MTCLFEGNSLILMDLRIHLACCWELLELVPRHSGGVKAGVPAVAVSTASTPSNSSLTPRSAIFTCVDINIDISVDIIDISVDIIDISMQISAVLTSPLSARSRLLGLMSRWITFW